MVGGEHGVDQVDEAVGVCPHLLRDLELTLPEFALAHLSFKVSNYIHSDKLSVYL